MAEISVIVPVYNSEKYLPACLNSLKNQTFSNLEFICVDDGSTDDSYEILKNYAKKDKRFKIYRQQNQGVAAARNAAMQYATGKWLVFCDSDDTVPDDAYQHFYDVSQDVDVVIGDFFDVDDYGCKNKITTKAKHKNNTFYALFKIPCVWAKMIRKEWLLKTELSFENVRLGEDVIFLAHMAVLKPRYKVISYAVYNHWNHNCELDKSLTHLYDLSHFQAHMYCRNELLRICWEEANLQEAYYYVYHDMLGYPFEFLFRMPDFAEKEKAFQLFKEHLQRYDWSLEQERFTCMMGMPYEKFMESSAQHYFATTQVLNHAEVVLNQYKAGMLGFRYILKYAQAWWQYKVKRFQLERKK